MRIETEVTQLSLPLAPAKVYCVYGLYDPRTEELRYVGATGNLRHRLIAHQRRERHESLKSRRWLWIGELRQLGLQPAVKIIEECDLEVLASREGYWISFYRHSGAKLVNVSFGGGIHSTFAKRKSKPENPFPQSRILEIKQRVDESKAGRASDKKSDYVGPSNITGA
jgi:hypothetical protein